MPSAQDVIDVASGEVGYSRWTDFQSGTKYGRWYADLVGEPYYAKSGVPYCAMFVSWVFEQAGVRCAGLPGAYCPAMLQDAIDAGASVSDPGPGDVVYFDWGNDGESDHVGIVVAVHGSTIDTIEGNTSGGSSGSQTNGGIVARKSRNLSVVCGFVRPQYGAPAQTVGELDIDGVIGRLTVSEWQRQCGVPVTGVVSGQLADCKNSYPALASVTYEADGSELMRRVQEIVGVPNPTGIIAGGTVCMLQGWLVLHGYSCAQDRAGVLGVPTAKALQQSLNDGAWK